MANFDLSKLMEGKNPQAVMLAETRQLKSKWEKTGLLEGLKDRDQHSMAVLLENQAKQLLDEATQSGTAPKKEIIAESNELANRFKQLAGIITK